MSKDVAQQMTEMPQNGLDEAQEKLVRYIRGRSAADGRCGWVGEMPPVWPVVCDVSDYEFHNGKAWQLECKHGVRGIRYGLRDGGEDRRSASGGKWHNSIKSEPGRLPDCTVCKANAIKWCVKEDRKAAKDAKRERRRQRQDQAGEDGKKNLARWREVLPVPAQWIGLAATLGMLLLMLLAFAGFG